MLPTHLSLPDEASRALADLSTRLGVVLGNRLLGLYLYGSAVWGDFDADISDLDLLAVVRTPILAAELPSLVAMHAGFVADHPAFADRVEVQYFTPEGLRDFRERASSMANISPGEPLHLIEAGRDWLSNWYFVQEYGVTLYGPAPAQFIPLIDETEFLAIVRDYANYWRAHVSDTRASLPAQSYAILTVCRAAYTLTLGEQVSKRKAAAWMAARSPRDAALIADAWRWRAAFRDEQSDAADAYPRTEEFVLRTVNQLLAPA